MRCCGDTMKITHLSHRSRDGADRRVTSDFWSALPQRRREPRAPIRDHVEGPLDQLDFSWLDDWPQDPESHPSAAARPDTVRKLPARYSADSYRGRLIRRVRPKVDRRRNWKDKIISRRRIPAPTVVAARSHITSTMDLATQPSETQGPDRCRQRERDRSLPRIDWPRRLGTTVTGPSGYPRERP